MGCKLSDIFIKDTDEVATKWQDEIKRRMTDNEDGGLKVFGSGLRKIRQQSGKTIAQAAKDAGMTLSVYHKIEVGQREVYKNEIEPLAKSFAQTVESLFAKIANLYKSGELTKNMDKAKERVRAALVAEDESSDLGDMQGHLYGAKLYASARKKLGPVFGAPEGKAIKFIKSDNKMINTPASLDGRRSVYAVVPNSKRLGGFIPENSYVFADAKKSADVGDLAVFLNEDFGALKPDTQIIANIAMVRKDSKGNVYGQLVSPEEKITAKVMHKVIMIVTE